jgi:outer membrane protein
MINVNRIYNLGLTRLPNTARAAGSIVLSAAMALLWSGTALAQSRPVDLKQVYEQARQYDAEYSAAQYDLDAARQQVPLARSAFGPQLSLGGNVGATGVTNDSQGTFAATSLSLSLSQTLFNRSNGKLLDQAKLGVMQAEAQYTALGQTLILRVATAYFEVLRAQANVEFSQSELQAISRQREQAERRFDVGLVPITDVRSAQAQYDLAVAQEIAASNQLSTAQEALVLISGMNPDLLAPLADDLPLVPPDPAAIDAWVDLARDQNLELVIARLANDSSQTQVEIQRARRYPTLDLIGTAATTTTEQLGRSDADTAQIQLQLNLPILTGGLVNAQVAQARAQALSSSEQLLARERATVQQTRDSYRGVQASISRVRALNQALVSTQKSAEATEAGFRAGTRTSVEVLQALRDTFSARSDYAGARYDYIINTLNLKAAAGTLSDNDIYAINRFLAVAE